MSPFNVKVITIISGEVNTNILRNDVHRQLPQGLTTHNAHYLGVLTSVQGHIILLSRRSSRSMYRGHQVNIPIGTSRFEYAANVVAQSLKSSPSAWFWYGSSTGIIRFFDTFGWRTFFVLDLQDSFFYRDFNLEKLRKAHVANMNADI
ncbi:hypothetical protein RRF57_013115 [Xylaria bambusicola]|uniref:Uncharacterized protein n=1 Tax=Xylaria bambusicola TaxID=326684 RepID=A0AAN7ZFC1_9PEZI